MGGKPVVHSFSKAIWFARNIKQQNAAGIRDGRRQFCFVGESSSLIPAFSPKEKEKRFPRL
jgi:hypothetical protein